MTVIIIMVGNDYRQKDGHDIKMSTMASQITGVSIVYLTPCWGADQRKHFASFVSQAYVGRIHRWPVKSPHKEPLTRKMFPFDNVIMPNC